MKSYQCPKCGEIDDIVSVEEEVYHYKIYPNGDGEKEYTGDSKCITGRIDFIMCKICNSSFSEDQLPKMVIDLEEEE